MRIESYRKCTTDCLNARIDEERVAIITVSITINVYRTSIDAIQTFIAEHGIALPAAHDVRGIPVY